MRRLVIAILQLLAQELAKRTRQTAKVTGTSGAKVVVDLNGTTAILPRLASYTPTVGDVVFVDTNGPALILGKSA